MSVTGFAQSDFFVTDFQKPLVSGQAFYYNDHFDSLDETDYSVIYNHHTDKAYLYFANDLYDTIISIPDEMMDLFSVIAERKVAPPLKITKLQTSADWVVSDMWHCTSLLELSITLKEIDGTQYAMLSSDYVDSERNCGCMFRVFDIHFPLSEIENICSRLQQTVEWDEIIDIPRNKQLLR